MNIPTYVLASPATSLKFQGKWRIGNFIKLVGNILNCIQFKIRDIITVQVDNGIHLLILMVHRFKSDNLNRGCKHICSEY